MTCTVRTVALALLLFACSAASCDPECMHYDTGVPKPDNAPCNAADICGRHRCMNGSCVESFEYTCDMDTTDRVSVIVTLALIGVAMFVIGLALLGRCGEYVAGRMYYSKVR